jgi:hypothetical protein
MRDVMAVRATNRSNHALSHDITLWRSFYHDYFKRHGEKTPLPSLAPTMITAPGTAISTPTSTPTLTTATNTAAQQLQAYLQQQQQLNEQQRQALLAQQHQILLHHQLHHMQQQLQQQQLQQLMSAHLQQQNVQGSNANNGTNSNSNSDSASSSSTSATAAVVLMDGIASTDCESLYHLRWNDDRQRARLTRHQNYVNASTSMAMYHNPMLRQPSLMTRHAQPMPVPPRRMAAPTYPYPSMGGPPYYPPTRHAYPPTSRQPQPYLGSMGGMGGPPFHAPPYGGPYIPYSNSVASVPPTAPTPCPNNLPPLPFPVVQPPRPMKMPPAPFPQRLAAPPVRPPLPMPPSRSQLPMLPTFQMSTQQQEFDGDDADTTPPHCFIQ